MKKTRKKVKKVKKRKLRYGRLFLVALIFLCFLFLAACFFNQPITNIYIQGNHYYKDQQIIELANLSDYPSSVTVIPSVVSRTLEKEELIKKAKVQKKGRSVSITITENIPLFYNTSIEKTVLSDGTTSKRQYDAPTLLNYVPDTEYDAFLKAMKKVDEEVLGRISEIQYAPDDVDTGRYLLFMRDGNYVYLTISRFEAINNYIEIIREFPNQKGILYLNAGNSFEVLENND